MSTPKKRLSAPPTALRRTIKRIHIPLGSQWRMNKRKSKTQSSKELNRTFKVFAGVYFVSQTGTWFKATALPLAVQDMTADRDLYAQWLGLYVLVTAGVRIPSYFWGGQLADRIPPRVLMLSAQALIVTECFVVWHMVAAGSTLLGLLIALEAFDSLGAAIGLPAQKKLSLSLVSKETETRAVTLNALLYSLSLVIGPAIAGVLLIWMTPAQLLLADIFSYLPLLVMLIVLRWFKVQQASGEQGTKEPVIRYIWQKPTLRLVLLFTPVATMLCYNGNIINPLMASEVFHVKIGYGLLLAAQGGGQVVSTFLTERSSRKPMQRWLLRPEMHQMLLWRAVSCVFLVGYGLSHWFPLALLLMALNGFCEGPYGVAVDCMTQTIPDDSHRGRVMGIKGGLNALGRSLGGPFTAMLITSFGVIISLQIQMIAMLALIATIAAVRKWSPGRARTQADTQATHGSRGR